MSQITAFLKPTKSYKNHGLITVQLDEKMDYGINYLHGGEILRIDSKVCSK